jgi:hypothetical protein
MELNLIMYLIGVIVSIALGLHGIGMFNRHIKFSVMDVVLVLIVSVVFHWLGAMIFFFGYGKPQEGHPDVI